MEVAGKREATLGVVAAEAESLRAVNRIEEEGEDSSSAVRMVGSEKGGDELEVDAVAVVAVAEGVRFSPDFGRHFVGSREEEWDFDFFFFTL